MKMAVTKRKLGPPGVRFHPTDEELVCHYLKRRVVMGKPLEGEEAGYVAEAKIYQFHPADLREFACFSKEKNWYFFCTAENKYGSGERKDRSTHCGFWKPTGIDRDVIHKERTVGKIKTLVFHEGKPAKAVRTNWVMHEYRLVEDGDLGNKGKSVAVVLCKIFKKRDLGPRNGEQFGAEYDEDEWEIEEENNALESIAVQGQSESAVMNENDSVCAGANPLLHATEQVFSGAATLSEIIQPSTPTSNGANVASTSHGFTFDANPFQKTPVAGSDIASSSKGPVPDQIDETFCPGEFGVDIFGNLDNLPGIHLWDLGKKFYD